MAGVSIKETRSTVHSQRIQTHFLWRLRLGDIEKKIYLCFANFFTPDEARGYQGCEIPRGITQGVLREE